MYPEIQIFLQTISILTKMERTKGILLMRSQIYDDEAFALKDLLSYQGGKIVNMDGRFKVALLPTLN